MNDRAATTERPIAITIICILGFIAAGLSVFGIFLESTSMVGAWYPPYAAFSALVLLACMIGLWKMQKWSVFTYAAFVALNQCVLFAMGFWSILALLIPAVVVAIGFIYLPRMK